MLHHRVGMNHQDAHAVVEVDPVVTMAQATSVGCAVRVAGHGPAQRRSARQRDAADDLQQGQAPLAIVGPASYRRARRNARLMGRRVLRGASVGYPEQRAAHRAGKRQRHGDTPNRGEGKAS